MKFTVITLFPELVTDVFRHGLIGQALKKNLLSLDCINPRKFTSDIHHSVDDRPFGGGDGMIMMIEPLAAAIAEAKLANPEARVFYLSPQGPVLTDRKARDLSQCRNVILLCGRYGGIDQRLLLDLVDEELSIGDYVLAGGELAAAVVIEATARLLPGVLGHEQSAHQDSFADGVLEAPNFTRPREWQGLNTPEILLSGNHAKIAQWRESIALLVTLKKRPEIFWASKHASKRNELESFWQSLTAEEKKVLGLGDISFQR